MKINNWLWWRNKPSPLLEDWQAIIAHQYRSWLKKHGPGHWQRTNLRTPSLSILLVGSQESTITNLELQTYSHWQLGRMDHLGEGHVVLLESQSQLWPDGLERIASSINDNPDADIMYFDSEIYDRRSGTVLPYFKPDYSPDLLLSTPYFGSPIIIKSQLLRQLLKDLPETGTPLFLWETCLRAVEQTDRVVHIPTIVGRESYQEISSSGWPNVDGTYQRGARDLIGSTLARRGLLGYALDSPISGAVQVKYQPDGKLVSIIVSTKDRVELLRRCVEGILHTNDYHNWELIIVNNNSVEPATHRYLRKVSKHSKIRVIDYPKPFNIAAIFNLAVGQAKGEYIAFLGNDTEPISPDWLSRMVGYMNRPEVGVVGAKLLYPNETIQHAGVVLGYGSAPDNSDRVAGHPYSQYPQQPGYFGTIELQRNCSAVTGAVTLTRRALYEKVRGYDAENLQMLFNDVDYCLKVRREGYYIVYAPEAVLYHRERASLGEVNVNFHINPDEIRYMRTTWGFWEDNDPFYNPNLTLDRPDYSLRLSE